MTRTCAWKASAGPSGNRHRASRECARRRGATAICSSPTPRAARRVSRDARRGAARAGRAAAAVPSKHDALRRRLLLLHLHRIARRAAVAAVIHGTPCHRSPRRTSRARSPCCAAAAPSAARCSARCIFALRRGGAVRLAAAAISAALATHPATGLAILTLRSAVVGASSLPPAAHKTLLALSADVTAALRRRHGRHAAAAARAAGRRRPRRGVRARRRTAAAAPAPRAHGRAHPIAPRGGGRRAALRRRSRAGRARRRRRAAVASRGRSPRGGRCARRRRRAARHARGGALGLPCRRRAAARWDEAQRACLRSLLTSACAADAALRARATAATRRWRSILRDCGRHSST